ncbi:response regulator [Leucothrix sargassi]|nr:response regulator [Leucothrix sargassi]
MPQNILCIEDEASIRQMLRFSLTRSGYQFAEAENAAQMSEQLGMQLPDLILIDWMLPDASGPDLVKQLRKDPMTRDIPIIMLTAKAEEENMIQGLDAGADDYITKPVSLKSLNARIKALLRRTTTEADAETISYDALTLNLASQTILVDDVETPIAATEMKLLRYFMQNKERVLSRTQLLDHVWGHNNFIEERTVDVHILRLRKLLKSCSADHLIQTVRGSGYKLSK